MTLMTTEVTELPVLQVAARDPPGHGIADYISPTRLNLWLKCPLAFRFRYLDGIKPPTSPALFLGKALHACLEYFYRERRTGVIRSLPELVEHLSGTWDELALREAVVFESTNDESELKQQARQLLITYMRQYLSKDAMPIEVESRLSAPLVETCTGENLGIALVGIIDLVLAGSAGPIIVDFKTASRGGTPVDVAHEIQLTCYAYLLRQTRQQVESQIEVRSLIKTKSPKIETHRWPAREQKHFRRLFAVTRAYLNDVHSNRFVFRPSWACQGCDFREPHCGNWSA